ncbi:nucleotide disphospho-sugar-binding domain-containing protein [Methylopila sp. M107]|uniref:glycosyltransferase n=1 Tax=Methylopila sp. M107 TaxID=1101190 RepID=UPI000368995B|nr:nucleotide disphospho-sugar-binding domain-containing protein [Methylopila sp. M107]
MLILIAAFGSHGDVLPLVAIGAELKRRGHRVIVGTMEPFGPIVERAGLEFEQIGTEAEYREGLGHADLWRPIRGARRLFAFAELGIRPTLEFIERRRDRKTGTLVVASTLAIGARLAHDVFKVPIVTVHLSPMLLQSRYAPPKLPFVPEFKIPPWLEWEFQLGVDEWFIDPHITPKLNAVRAEHGLPPVKRLRHWWNAPRRVLLMWPDWFAPPQADWPKQMVCVGFPRVDALGGEGGPLDPALEAFLAAGDPPVAVTFGTAMRSGAALYRAAIRAALKAGRRCLVLSPVEVDVPSADRERVFRAGYTPFGQVLPRCAAFIHHGGIGTTSQALAAGVPQLVAPLAFDQFDNAARVRKLGCGLVVERLALKTIYGAQKLRRLLGSRAIAEACARMALLGDGRAVARACDEIETEYVRRGKRSGSHAVG